MGILGKALVALQKAQAAAAAGSKAVIERDQLLNANSQLVAKADAVISDNNALQKTNSDLNDQVSALEAKLQSGDIYPMDDDDKAALPQLEQLLSSDA